MTMIVPVKLYIMANRLFSSRMPSHTRRSFTTPCCCSMIIQATMRTSNDVQNGINTQIIRILLVGILILYWVYDKIVGIDNMKMG